MISQRWLKSFLVDVKGHKLWTRLNTYEHFVWRNVFKDIEILKWCSWWRHQMETFPVFLVLYEGNPPVTGGFPSQRPVMRSFYIFFHLPDRTIEQTIETPLIWDTIAPIMTSTWCNAYSRSVHQRTGYLNPQEYNSPRFRRCDEWCAFWHCHPTIYRYLYSCSRIAMPKAQHSSHRRNLGLLYSCVKSRRVWSCRLIHSRNLMAVGRVLPLLPPFLWLVSQKIDREHPQLQWILGDPQCTVGSCDLFFFFFFFFFFWGGGCWFFCFFSGNPLH